MYERERVLSEHTISSDLALTADIFVPHLNLAVEVDGTDHFVSSSGHATGKTLFRNGILRDCGLLVLCIDHRLWSPLKGLTAKVDYLSEKILSVIN